jgi:TLD
LRPTGNQVVKDIITNFLLNSKCATEKQQKEYLHKILGNKQLVTTLLYSGSIHGWMAIDFHSRCDNKGPTISLFKIKDGDCIGGYTKAKWSSKEDYYYEKLDDSEAMLFNLSCCRHFPTLNKGREVIYCRNDWGPYFSGNGYRELGAEY